MTESGWWYSFVTAAPVPETGEAVNVGIVVGNGGLGNLTYARGLPRLAGLVSATDRSAFEAVLENAYENVRRGRIDLPTLKATIGPQLRVTEPRALRHAPDKEVLDVLERKYLRGPRAPRPAEERLVKDARARLDVAINRSVRHGIDILNRPANHRVYPSVSMGRRVPVLGRVLRASSRDLLVDAVLLVPGQITLAVRSATERIGLAFYYYARFQERIEQEEHRSFRLLGVIASDHEGWENAEVTDAGGYIEEVWSRHATVLRANGADPVLRPHIDWLIEPNGR